MTIQYKPRTIRQNVNVSRESPLKELGVLVGSLVLCIIVIYAALGFAVDWAVGHISTDVEKQLGSFFSEHLFSDNPEKEWAHQEDLQQILDRLVRHMDSADFEFQVKVIDSDTVNAAALPGGKILFFKGLLDLLSTENQVAAVLAHELGHYAHRDHLRGLGRGIVLMVLSSVLTGADSEATAFVSQLIVGTQLSYSRGQETAADEYGLQLLQNAYGHVGGAAEVFELMAESEEHSGGSFFEELFATHPIMEHRKEYIGDIINKKGLSELPQQALPWTRYSD